MTLFLQFPFIVLSLFSLLPPLLSIRYQPFLSCPFLYQPHCGSSFQNNTKPGLLQSPKSWSISKLPHPSWLQSQYAPRYIVSYSAAVWSLPVNTSSKDLISVISVKQVRVKSSLYPHICTVWQMILFFSKRFHTVIKVLSSPDENGFDLEAQL